jgi:sugar phosphate isomerase/epimerase
MTTKSLPKIGAALPIEALVTYRDWLIEGQRDLEIQDAFNPTVLDGDWKPLVRQAKSLLDGFQGRMGIHGPFMSLTILARDPKIRTVVSERLHHGLEFAAELGATHMVVHSPFDFFGSPFLPHSPGHGLTEQLQLIHETVDPVLPFAEQIGCTLVIENIYDTNPAPLLALVRSFNSDYVRMSLDTGHAMIKHQIGGPSPDQWVREAGALLGHIHVQDTDGQIDRHWRPGVGRINWHALFESLETLAHQPRMVLELRHKEEVLQGAQWLIDQGLAQ